MKSKEKEMKTNRDLEKKRECETGSAIERVTVCVTHGGVCVLSLVFMGQLAGVTWKGVCSHSWDTHGTSAGTDVQPEPTPTSLRTILEDSLFQWLTRRCTQCAFLKNPNPLLTFSLNSVTTATMKSHLPCYFEYCVYFPKTFMWRV